MPEREDPELMDIANELAQTVGVTGVEELPPEQRQVVEQVISGVARSSGDKEELVQSGDIFGKMQSAIARAGRRKGDMLGTTQEGSIANMQKAAMLTNMAQDIFYNRDGSVNKEGVGVMDANTFASYAASAASSVPENGGIQVYQQQGPGSSGLGRTINTAIRNGADKNQTSIAMMKEAETRAAEYERGMGEYEKELRDKGGLAERLKRRQDEIKALEQEIGTKFVELEEVSTETHTDAEGNVTTSTRSSRISFGSSEIRSAEIKGGEENVQPRRGRRRRAEEAVPIRDVEEGKTQLPVYSNDYRRRVQSAILNKTRPIRELGEMVEAKDFEELKEEAEELGMPDITNPENAEEVGRKVKTLRRRAKKEKKPIEQVISEEKERVAEKRKEEEKKEKEPASEEMWTPYKAPSNPPGVKNDAEVMDDWLDELTQGKEKEVKEKGFAHVVNEADSNLTVFDVDREKETLNNPEVLNKKVDTRNGRKEVWKAMGYTSEEEAQKGMKGEEMYNRMETLKGETGSRSIPFTDNRHIAMAPEVDLHRRRNGEEEVKEPSSERKEEAPEKKEETPQEREKRWVDTYRKDFWQGYKEEEVGDWDLMNRYGEYMEKISTPGGHEQLTEEDKQAQKEMSETPHGRTAYGIIRRMRDLGLGEKSYGRAAKYISEKLTERGGEEFNPETMNAKEYVERNTLGGQGLSVKETADMLMNKDVVGNVLESLGSTTGEKTLSTVIKDEELQELNTKVESETPMEEEPAPVPPLKQEEGKKNDDVKWADAYRTMIWSQYDENSVGTWDELNAYNNHMEKVSHGEKETPEEEQKYREARDSRQHLGEANRIINKFRQFGLSKSGYQKAAKYISDLSEKRGDSRVEGFNPETMDAKEYVEKYTIGGEGLSVKETAEMLMDKDAVGEANLANFGAKTGRSALHYSLKDKEVEAIDAAMQQGISDEEIEQLNQERKEQREQKESIPTNVDYTKPEKNDEVTLKRIPQPIKEEIPEEEVPDRPELAVKEEIEEPYDPERKYTYDEDALEPEAEEKKNSVTGLETTIEEKGIDTIPELDETLGEERIGRGEEKGLPGTGDTGGKEGGGEGGPRGNTDDQMVKFFDSMNEALTSLRTNVEGIRSDVERIKNQGAANM